MSSTERGTPLYVPLTITVKAVAQDNGDGTWTVGVPTFTTRVETADSMDAALRKMADALSWVTLASVR